MNDPICAVCGETDIKKMTMFNYGVCLCHRCLEISAHSFIHDNTERRPKENKKKVISVEGLPKAEHESMTEFKDRLRKEIEGGIEAKVRAEIEAKRKASRITEAAIKFANGTHESLMCNCPGCGKQVPRKDMKRFSRGEYYHIFHTEICPDCFREKNREYNLREVERKLEEAKRAFHDLKDEYESFRGRTSRVWWGMMIAGIAIGTLLTLMFLNPR